MIGPSSNNDFRKEIHQKMNTGKTLSEKWNQIWKKQFNSKDKISIMSIEDIKNDIDTKLNIFFDKDFIENQDKLKDIMSK